MLYLVIDQHKNHLTLNIRNKQGDVFQKGRISTKPDDIDEFFAGFAKKACKRRKKKWWPYAVSKRFPASSEKR